jgi:5-hydroxyisourate hydrolase-like protein (transthyretin family)
MKRGLIILATLIALILLTHTISATITGVTIGDTDYLCGEEDGICPSDYAGCAGDGTCYIDGYIDDPDCCLPEVCSSFWCTATEEVCGDSTNERTINEADSELDNVDGTGSGDGIIENCAGTCTTETEGVIDDSNEPACADSVEDGDVLGFDVTENCADDGALYRPISYTTLCSTDVSCHDTDDDGDLEICSNGGWHDADESETYCDAIAGTWVPAGVESGTDAELDDYDNDLATGYCSGEDGFTIYGAIVAELTRGSEYCEPAEGITIKIVSKDDTETTIVSTVTTYAESWSTTLGCHEETSANDVGYFELTVPEGEYYLVAEEEGYNTVTTELSASSSEADADGFITVPAFWIYLAEGCQADCTMNDGICYEGCDGVNSCAFQTYEETGESVGTYCNGLREGYRYVLSEEEDEMANTISGDEVYCCTGTPQTYEREHFTAEDAETNCVENIISKDKGFTLNGEFVQFHFVMFSDPDPTKDDCEEYEGFMCEMYGGGWC